MTAPFARVPILEDAELRNRQRRADIMSMPIRSIAAPRYTVDEIESWPDDGNRYELLDGVLLVTPSPNPTHQLVATEIARILSEFLEPWPQLLFDVFGVDQHAAVGAGR